MDIPDVYIDNTCFICMVHTLENGITPINLELVNTCNCKGLVHLTCYLNWLNNNNTCPICRVINPVALSISNFPGEYNSRSGLLNNNDDNDNDNNDTQLMRLIYYVRENNCHTCLTQVFCLFAILSIVLLLQN